jgi:hypothetical protein
MSDIFFFVAPAAVGIVSLGGYLVSRWWGSPAVRALRRAPRRPIKGFPEGSAGRIVGVVETYEGRTVRTPLTGRACVAYSVRVEEYQGQGNSGRWEPMVQDFDAVNFVVADDTGRALVRAAGSWPSPIMYQVGGSGMFNDAPPALEEFLNAHGRSSHGFVFNRKLRCEEGALFVGTKVAVLGIGRRESEPLGDTEGASYRESPGRLVIECLDDGTLPMSNAPAALR